MQTWVSSQVSSNCTKNVSVPQLTATGRKTKQTKKTPTPKEEVFPHLCPGKVVVTADHDTLGFWQSSGWFCSADMGWSMLSVLPFSRNASSILDYYRGCSVSVSSFCRIWVHMKRDQESLVGCAWLWAQSLLERCVFLDIQTLSMEHLFYWKPLFSEKNIISSHTMVEHRLKVMCNLMVL